MRKYGSRLKSLGKEGDVDKNSDNIETISKKSKLWR